MTASPRPQTVRDDLAGALRRSKVFDGADEDSLLALAATGRRRSWAEGQTVFQRGDTDTYLLAITSGRVRLALSTARGRELVLRHVGAGEVIGEFALIDAKPRSADAVAVEPTTGIILTRDAFMAEARQRPSLGLAIAQHLCDLLRSTNFQMESIALYDLQMRVARFLLSSLRGTHGSDAPETVVLRHGLNQGELALIVGASRPKVNQVLQVLFAEGILIRQGADILCRRSLLENHIADHEAGDD